jgi:hypothetical protein
LAPFGIGCVPPRLKLSPLPSCNAAALRMAVSCELLIWIRSSLGIVGSGVE